MSKNEIVEAEKPQGGTALAVFDYGEDAGGGFENTTKDDFKLPFLRLLQPNSPQVIDEVNGAKAGYYVNTVTGAVFSEVLFVPAITQHLFVGWKPRKPGQAGGGESFGGVFSTTDPMVVEAIRKVGGKFVRDQESKKIIQPRTPDGEYDLIETNYFQGVQLIEETGALVPAVLTFFSTGLPVSQAWLTTARQEVIPNSGGRSKPLFAHIYKLGSTKVSRGENKWYVPTFAWAQGSAKESLLDPKSDLYQAAKSVRDLVQAGKADIDHAAQGNATEGGAAAGEGGGSKAAADKNIPF